VSGAFSFRRFSFARHSPAPDHPKKPIGS
jgi:hypothetical protein